MSIRITEEDDAGAETQEFYEFVTEYTDGRVPASAKFHGDRSELMEIYTAFTPVIRGESLLPKALKEQIAVLVAQTNNAEACVSEHTGNLRALGFDDDAIDSILENYYMTEFDDATVAALEFAETITRNEENVTNEDVERLRDVGYTDGEIKEIVVVTGYHNYMNPVVDLVELG